MKALFTSHTANFQKFNHANIALLKKNGYQVDYASAAEEKVQNVHHSYKVDFARSPWRLDLHLRAYRQLKKILHHTHYDLIHTHTPVGSVITRLAARHTRRQGTQVIYTAHGFHFYTGGPLRYWLLWYPIEKFAAHLTDTIITINQEDYHRAKTHFKTRVKYIPGVGVNPKAFQIKMTTKQRNNYRKSLGLTPKDFLIIYVAEISRRKNQAQLLKNQAPRIKKQPHTHILLVGTDSTHGRIRRLAHRLHIEKNVHFLGYRRDIPQLLKISDLYCSTSRQEGLAINLLEARLIGLPIEASHIRGNDPAFAKDLTPYFQSNITKQMTKIYKIGDH